MSKVIKKCDRPMAHVVLADNGFYYYVDTTWLEYKETYELMAFQCDENGKVYSRSWGRPAVVLTCSDTGLMMDLHDHVIYDLENYLCEVSVDLSEDDEEEWGL